MALSRSSNNGPLSDLIVVDLTRYLSGPYCTLLLADLGARVIKIESPGNGDDSRYVPPGKSGQTAYFMSINRGKESIALDLKKPEDRAVLDTLMSEADILVENFRPGVMDKLGYSADTIAQRHPSLIYGSISGFGQTGPWRDLPAYDLVVQALSGMMSINGHPDGEPTRVGTSIGDLCAGVYAALAIVAAVNERRRTGRGSRVDVAMLDCQVALLESHYMRHHVTGEEPGRVGSRHPLITPFDTFACKDGYIVICTVGDSMYRSLVNAIGLPELAEHPSYLTPRDRLDNTEALKRELEAKLATEGREYWLKLIGAAGIPCSPINSIPEMSDNEQLKARGMFVECAADDFSFKAVRTPVRTQPGFAEGYSERAPQLNEDGDRIRGELAQPSV
ncbi:MULTISPECIES: CaiB/BaiF CoA-transferase family protein [unclassified Achromobacter]|uniref:CaiB/BaiF CoA transferase family protein n=1 Tax=unclassified Achromobacter TaxID=2626865 RepID=UPI000B5161EE|nr:MULTISPECIES: CaiB/BaiF CoA-transferase family protein [unclassified Achromobacter]OWT69105.1 carnitine dehydratase [Achromobacter sp. HZ34]OWT70510.1 carnitine dehydratase [Achromobacter sp. HZ28]